MQTVATHHCLAAIIVGSIRGYALLHRLPVSVRRGLKGSKAHTAHAHGARSDHAQYRATL